MPNEKELEETEQENEEELEDDQEELEASEGEEEDDDDEDEESDDGPHPGEVILSSINELKEQLKRLESRNSGNLKFELVNNVYPIILSIAESLIQWMAGIEEDLDELMADEPEDEVDPEVAKAMEEGTKKVIRICEKITKLEETPNDPVLMKEVTSWAKETLASVKQTPIAPVTK